MKLEGLRVIDLSQFLPGPQLTLMMADQGAEVIKIEPPGEGEPGRHIGVRDGEHTVFFRNTQRGKRSVCLNLKNPEDRESLLRLCDTADVFVEAFRPGVVKRLGVDYDTLAARNPRIVYCSISAFGQTGPYRDLPAHDLAIESVAGVVSLNLGNDGEPVMPHVPAADMAASMLALSGVLMALYRREKTGLGDYLDIAMFDAILAWTPNITSQVFANKRPPIVKHERSLGGSAFYNIYRTRDGKHVVLGAQEIKFVRNLLQALGRAEFVELCERGPGPHQAPLIAFLRETFRTRSRDEWDAYMADLDVAYAPVLDFAEAFAQPHIAERGLLNGVHIAPAIRFAGETYTPGPVPPLQGDAP